MLDIVNIFSFIPRIVLIWRAVVSLEQQMLKIRRYCTHKPGLEIIAGDLVRALKLRSWLRHSNMEDSGGSLRALTTKIHKETSLDYDNLAKIQ